MNGTISRLVEGKNFGFINVAGGEKDYFFHRDDLKGEWDRIAVGLDVKFDEAPSPKGLRAANVVVVL